MDAAGEIGDMFEIPVEEVRRTLALTGVATYSRQSQAADRVTLF